MGRRAKHLYRPGLHLALRTDGGYRPAMVMQDGGNMVKVRYTAHGLIEEHWVDRRQLIPPPWAGSRHP
jgi:hypothetical protein